MNINILIILFLYTYKELLFDNKSLRISFIYRTDVTFQAHVSFPQTPPCGS